MNPLPPEQNNISKVISLIETAHAELKSKSLVFETNVELQSLNEIQLFLNESSEATLDSFQQKAMLYLLTAILNASIFYDDENDPNTVQYNFETSYFALQIFDQSKYQFPYWHKYLAQDLTINLSYKTKPSKSKMKTRSTVNIPEYTVPVLFQTPINFLKVIKKYLNPNIPNLYFEFEIPLINQISRLYSGEVSHNIGITPFLSIFKKCEKQQQLLIITMVNQMIQISPDVSYCQYLDSLLEMSTMCNDILHHSKMAHQFSMAQLYIIKSLSTNDRQKSIENAKKISETYVHNLFNLVLEKTVPIIQNQVRDDEEKHFYLSIISIVTALLHFKQFYVDFITISKSHAYLEFDSKDSDYQFDLGKLIFVFKEKPGRILTLLHKIFSMTVIFFFNGNLPAFNRYMQSQFTDEDFEQYSDLLEPSFNQVFETVKEIAVSTQPALIHLITMGILDDDLFNALKCFRETLGFHVPPFSAIKGKFMSVLVTFASIPFNNQRKRKIHKSFDYRSFGYIPSSSFSLYGNYSYGDLLTRYRRIAEMLGNGAILQRLAIIDELRNRSLRNGATISNQPRLIGQPFRNGFQSGAARPNETQANGNPNATSVQFNRPNAGSFGRTTFTPPSGTTTQRTASLTRTNTDDTHPFNRTNSEPFGVDDTGPVPHNTNDEHSNDSNFNSQDVFLDALLMYDEPDPINRATDPLNQRGNQQPPQSLQTPNHVDTSNENNLLPPQSPATTSSLQRTTQFTTADPKTESSNQNDQPHESEFVFTNKGGSYSNKLLVITILLYFADHEEVADSFFLDILKYDIKRESAPFRRTDPTKAQKYIEKYQRDFSLLEKKINEFKESHNSTLTEDQIKTFTLKQIADLILTKSITKVSFLKDGLIHRCLCILTDIENRKEAISQEQKLEEEQAAIVIINYCFELINIIPIKFNDLSLTKTIAPVLQYLQHTVNYRYNTFLFEIPRSQFMSTIEALINMKEQHLNKVTLTEYSKTKPEIMKLLKTDLESVTWPSQFAYLYRALEHPSYQRKIIQVNNKLYTHMDSQCRVYAENDFHHTSVPCRAFNESSAKKAMKMSHTPIINPPINDYEYDLPSDELDDNEEEAYLEPNDLHARAFLYDHYQNEEEEEASDFHPIGLLEGNHRIPQDSSDINESDHEIDRNHSNSSHNDHDRPHYAGSDHARQSESDRGDDQPQTKEEIQQNLRSLVTPPVLKEKCINDILPILHLLSRFHEVFVSDPSYQSFYQDDNTNYLKHRNKSKKKEIETDNKETQNENDVDQMDEIVESEIIRPEELKKNVVSNELLESFINPDFCSLISYLITPDDIIFLDSSALATIISYPMLFPLSIRTIALKLWTLPPYSAIRVFSREILNKESPDFANRTNGEDDDFPPLEEQVIYLIVDRYDKEKGDPAIFFQQGCEIMKRFAPNPESFEIEFRGEEGTGRGPTHEFFTHFSRMFSEIKCGLFRHTNSHEDSEGQYCTDPLGLFPSFDANPELFTILGILCAKALQMECLIDLYINPAFFKLCRNKMVDLSEVDPQIASSLEKKEDFIGFPSFEFMNHELIPNGSEKEVTEENVDQFIDLVRDLIIGTGIQKCVDSFMNGFEQVMSFKSLNIFTENEISLLLCGSLTVNITEDDFEHNIIYENGYSNDSSSITKFKEIVLYEMTQEDQQALIQFITGFNRLPLDGLVSVRPILSISQMVPLTRNPNENNQQNIDSLLPTVSTCLNSLKLPPYSTKEIMKEKLLMAIREGLGFQKL